MKPKLAWSYTALTSFETCPKRYYLTRIAKKVKEPETEATKWGNAVHEALEYRVKEGRPLPQGMEQWEPLVQRIISKQDAEVTAEQQLCLDANLEPTSWFSKTAWLRGIIDVSVKRGNKVFVADWKTGKVKVDSDQLKLFAALVFHHCPDVNEVITAFIWLKEGRITHDKFTREQLPEIWQSFMPRVQRIEIAIEKDKWPARPSGLCRNYCPVGKTLCDHCGT